MISRKDRASLVEETYKCLPIRSDSQKELRACNLHFSVVQSVIDLGDERRDSLGARCLQCETLILHQCLVVFTKRPEHVSIPFKNHNCFVRFLLELLNRLKIFRLVFTPAVFEASWSDNGRFGLQVAYQLSTHDALTAPTHLCVYHILKPLKIRTPPFACPMGNEQVGCQTRCEAF